MGSGVPLLNEYKQEFFWRRFPQSVLGGPKLRFGYRVLPIIYIAPVLTLIFPWVLGGVFTLLVETNVMHYDVAIYILGSMMTAVVLLLNIVASILKKKVVVSKKTNLLKEDDEMDFESCCSGSTFSFIFPGKIFRVNIVIHALLSGALCGLGLWYLLPSTLNERFYNNLAVTVLLFILGWIVICIAQYSLTTTAPPEVAAYKALDTYELAPLMRPFYVLLFLGFHICSRYVESLVAADRVLHVLFVFLPLLWMAGLLPPLDAALLWLCEQTTVTLFGGSPTASHLRLCVMLLCSAGCYCLTVYVTDPLMRLLLMAVPGFLFSTDIGGLTDRLARLVTSRHGDVTPRPACAVRGWPLLSVAGHGVMLAVSVAVPLFLHLSAPPAAPLPALRWAAAGLLLLQHLLADCQRVYVCLGLLRNRLYPRSLERRAVFSPRRRALAGLGLLRRALISVVCPVLLLTCLTLQLQTDNTLSVGSDGNSTVDVFSLLGYTRAYRAVWTSYNFGLQLLFVSLGRERVCQALNKLYVWGTLMAMSWRDKKQRRSSTSGILLANVVFLPVVLTVVVVSSVLNAPLLPLFTLPIILFGYPRPSRCWPEAVGASANTNDDSVYYRQVAPAVAAALREGFASGSIGSARAGKHYLIRFQDRILWVHVIEAGFAFCSLNIKGLELQETSCHTLEAGRVDDLFQRCFENTRGFPCCFWNTDMLNVLRPYDAAYLRTYSDARNQLTGVIDQPDTLRAVCTLFPRALVWTLLHHTATARRETPPHRPASGPRGGQGSGLRLNKVSPARTAAGARGTERPATRSADSWDSLVQRPGSVSPGGEAGEGGPPGSGPSLWSDDDSLLQALSEPRGPRRLQPAVPEHHILRPAHTFGETAFNSRDDDVTDDVFLGFGLPAVDVSHVTGERRVSENNNVPKGWLCEHVVLRCEAAHARLLPEEWLRFSLSEDLLTDTARETFDTAWFQHVLKTLPSHDVSGNSPNFDLLHDEGFIEYYRRVVSACYNIFNGIEPNRRDPAARGPQHVYSVFTGDIPWSPAADVIKGHETFHGLVLKAYRYAVKLAFDQMLLGEVDSAEEMAEYFQSYDDELYIGNANEPAWHEAVLQEKQTLFSITHNTVEGTYHSRTLSLQDVPAHIGTVNSEAVRAQWANLSLELLYLTNDDEERYSIQAHPTMLRNLTVQAADPPLGYPIYSSTPVHVHTF